MKQSQHHPPPKSAEAVLREAAAAHLTEQLARNARLMAQCEELAGGKRGDKIGALNAASRLLRADAALMSQLARIAQIESIHRTIVETIPAFGPGGAYSNSNFSEDEEKEKESAVAELTRLIERHAEIDRREREKAIADAKPIPA